MQLSLSEKQAFNPISPATEMRAYEVLWDEQGASFKRIAEKFKDAQCSLPSDFVESSSVQKYKAICCTSS